MDPHGGAGTRRGEPGLSVQQSQAWRTVPPSGVARCRDRDVRTVIAAVQAAYSFDPAPTTGDWSEASAPEPRPRPQDLSGDGPGEGLVAADAVRHQRVEQEQLDRHRCPSTAAWSFRPTRRRQGEAGALDLLVGVSAAAGHHIDSERTAIRTDPGSAPARPRAITLSGGAGGQRMPGPRFALRLLCDHRRGAHSPRPPPQSAPGTWGPRLPSWVGVRGKRRRMPVRFRLMDPTERSSGHTGNGSSCPALRVPSGV